jgi:predicted RNA-binding Zn-ribbon protein involved in translation (DUF1610 family)
MATEPLCPYCQSTLAEGDARTPCPECGAHYHPECWEENGGCSVYGCKQTPPTEGRTEMEVPVSWWGQEQKPCPSCGKEILAAALRCRHCGATFASARPEDRAEFQERTQIAGRHPELRTRALWMFVLSVIPLCAPVGAIMGLAWYLPNRRKVDTLSGVYPALARLGLVVASVQTLAYVALFIIYLRVG